MKKFKVYAENIEKLYIVVDADNITDAYLKAYKAKQKEFNYTYELDTFRVLANNVEEIPPFEDFAKTQLDIELEDLREDYLNFYGLSERDNV